MGIPQVVFVILMTMDITVSLCWHGKKREGKYNALIAAASDFLLVGILYWGGFFG